RRLPDATPDPGVRDAGDAEHPPGVCVTGGLRPAGARSSVADVLEHPRPGEASGICGPPEVQRRSEVRGHPAPETDLEVVPGFGFPMNDRGSFFNLDPSSPDVIAPHKRPFLTIIPAFVMKEGQPLLSFGNMGGDEQAQAQATELVEMIDLGMNIQAAGDAA